MKLFILILIVLSFSCKSNKTTLEPIKTKFDLGTEIIAKITKIDSIDKFYLIYIENHKTNSYFKLVSFKDNIKPYNEEKIKVDKIYKFRIQQLTNRKPPKENDTLPLIQQTPMNYLDITECLKFNLTEICTESVFELAKAKNVDGIYITN